MRNLAAGHTAEAEAALRQALEIFKRIGAAEAAEVPPKLRGDRASLISMETETSVLRHSGGNQQLQFNLKKSCLATFP